MTRWMPVLGFYIQGDFGISAVLGEESDAGVIITHVPGLLRLEWFTDHNGEIPTAFTG
jgi:hypothetical protein